MHRNGGLIRCLVLSSLLVLGSTAGISSRSKLTQFPNEGIGLPSPQGQYIVESIDQDDIPNHRLVLRETTSGEVTELIEYSRYVDVAWSPRGVWLFINDYAGSNLTDCYVLEVVNSKVVRRIDIIEELRSSGYSSSKLGALHLYVAGIRWQSENRLRLEVSGYDEPFPRGFKDDFEYVIGGGFRRIK